jgi:hypothetical protein
VCCSSALWINSMVARRIIERLLLPVHLTVPRISLSTVSYRTPRVHTVHYCRTPQAIEVSCFAQIPGGLRRNPTLTGRPSQSVQVINSTC